MFSTLKFGTLFKIPQLSLEIHLISDSSNGLVTNTLDISFKISLEGKILLFLAIVFNTLV
jgi:hypothetical protein